MKQYCAINRITQCGIIKTNIALISPYNSQHDIKTLNDPNHPLLVRFGVGRVSQKCLGLICNMPVTLLAACKCSLTFEEAHTAIFRHLAEMHLLFLVHINRYLLMDVGYTGN